MSKRFQNISKYRNSVFAAKREHWIQCGPFSNNDPVPIAAGDEEVAFATHSGIGIFNYSNSNAKPEIRHIGAGPTRSIAFSPFVPALLATGGEDGSLRVWGRDESHLDLGGGPKVEAIAFNPSAQNIIAKAAGNKIQIWDISGAGSQVFDLDAGDLNYSITWKADGSILASTNKDHLLRVLDPRKGMESALTVPSHNGVKPSSATWLGNTDRIFTVGFNSRRDREYSIWDSRSLSKPLHLERIDNGAGQIMARFDADANMMYLIGRGDTSIRWLEVNDSEPWTVAGLLGFVHTAGSNFTGAALIPKRSVSVMAGEVARVMVTASDGHILPVSVTVPRRTYIDFHSDLFPDTYGDVYGTTAEEWIAGSTGLPPLTSLDPKKRVTTTKTVPTTPQTSVSPTALKPNAVAHGSFPAVPAPASAPKQAVSTTASTLPSQPTATDRALPSNPSSPPAPSKAVRTYGTPKQSSFRFVSGKISLTHENLRNLSISHPVDSNAIVANESWIAVAISGPGGRVGIISAKTSGRLPLHVPCFVCGSEVLDFRFDPFEPSRLLVASEDGRLRAFKVPEEGLKEDSGETESVVSAHPSRANLGRFHPTIRNLVVTASPGGAVKLYDWSEGKELVRYEHESEGVMALSFDFEGKYIATAARDKLIRVFELKSGKLIGKGKGHEGTKTARLEWIEGNQYLVSIGFGRNTREVLLYSMENLQEPIQRLTFDNLTGVIDPYYDEDLRLLYLSGRGDAFTALLEFKPAPENSFTEVARCTTSTQQQCLAFLPKASVDVQKVEISRAFRLTQGSIETVSFVVPRKLDCFHDDLFPHTRDVEKSAVSVKDWWEGGVSVVLVKKSLHPEGMLAASQIQAPQVVKNVKVVSGNEEKKVDLLSALIAAREEEESDEDPDKYSSDW
ncbi:hypothetical protein BJ742DRAFT_73314 [Cladochytrium replicatum]|nr:hypothetical protein BJ742DRAFT_73314 [Cladochytrium replicatum]